MRLLIQYGTGRHKCAIGACEEGFKAGQKQTAEKLKSNGWGNILDKSQKEWCTQEELNLRRQVFRCYPACPYRYLSLPVTIPRYHC